MRTSKSWIITFGMIFFFFGLNIATLKIFSQTAPFNKGVNLTGWFQVDSPRQIQFSKYTKNDFVQIKSLGCDVVRLPVNLHSMTNGEPDYILDPLFYTFLDQVVIWCQDLGINLILDNHTFSVTTDTDPNVGKILEKVWSQMATHYLSSSNLIYFEVLNEPHGINDATWNSIQKKVVTAIRKIDQKHTIVVGPASWNSYNNLDDMPVYEDTNLIYTFHFYDPFLFTHQGASWTDLTPVTGIPFPYLQETMPVCPQELKGTWVESNYSSYKNDGTVAKVQQLIDIAVKFSQQRNVPLFCGEFGVYDLNSPSDDRVYWYGEVRKYLEEKNIAWTIWDYQGAFGLYEKNSYGFFEHDLNIPLVEALGLNAPEQTPFIISPDSVGFQIFTDNIGPYINESSYSSGTLNYYSTDYPNRGEYCLYLNGASQYESVGFDFSPNKDLSNLVKDNFGLSMLVRGDDPNGKFDIRFIDTKTDVANDHPWRMRNTISNTNVEWDGQWHTLFFPLSGFTEHGSWDNNWYNPEGKFDWSAVDRFEIVTEYGAMSDYSLWIDDIVVTDKDTLKVNVIIGGSSNQILSDSNNLLQIKYVASEKNIVVKDMTGLPISYFITDITGKRWGSAIFKNIISIDCNNIPPGIYILVIGNKETGNKIRKIAIY